MLPLKHLFENFDLAKECLALYDIREDENDLMYRHFRISSNAIYPFYAKDGGVCFLRLAPTEEKAPTDVETELRFILWLREKGFPIMEPYAMKNGRLTDTVQTQWGEYAVSCFRAVPGRTLEDTDMDPQIAFGYGKTLGELHALAEKYPYAAERRSYTALLSEIRERLEAHGAPQKAFSELEAVTEALDGLEQSPAVFGLIHYDFEQDNVLFDPQSGRFGVIDPDDSLRCWYALDVMRAIDDLGEKETAAFLAGYRSVRTLTEEQMQTVPLLGRLVALQEYATILHVLSEPPEAEPDWMLRIVGKLRDKLRSIENSL